MVFVLCRAVGQTDEPVLARIDGTGEAARHKLVNFVVNALGASYIVECLDDVSISLADGTAVDLDAVTEGTSLYFGFEGELPCQCRPSPITRRMPVTVVR